MELVKIEKLLEKYLDAQTTIAEEKELRTFFCSDKVPDHLQEYRLMFGYFKENSNESYTQTILLKPRRKTNKNRKWLSVAASVAILTSAFVGKQAYDRHLQEKQFMQVKEALQMVSINLNKGQDAIYAVSDNINKAKEAITYLNTYENTVNKAINTINQ